MKDDQGKEKHVPGLIERALELDPNHNPQSPRVLGLKRSLAQVRGELEVLQKKYNECDRSAEQGENIIYSHSRLIWGHTSPHVTYKTLDEWLKFVSQFPTNELRTSKLEEIRVSPSAGLSRIVVH